MNTLKKLNALLDKTLKWYVAGLLVAIVIGALAELAGVAIILPIVNLATDDNYAENILCRKIMDLTGLQAREEILLVVIGLTIVIYIVKNIYLSWMYSCLYRFSAVVKKRLAVQLMESYLKQPYAFFLQKNTSDLIRSVNQDTSQLYEVILNCLFVASNGLMSLVLLTTVVIVNPVMALVVFLLLVLCAGVIILGVQKKTRYYGRRNQTLSGYLIKYLQQTFEGIKEIKILNSEPYFIRAYANAYQEQTDVVRRYHLVNLIPKYMIEAVVIVGIMAYLGVNIKYNDNYMELIPQLAAFVTAAYKMLPAVNAIYAYTNTIIYNRASIDLVYQDIQEANKIEYAENATSNSLVEKTTLEEKIELSHVTFQYAGTEKKILQDVSFDIMKGQSVAFIGPSGGGKTTTVDVILGLMSPQQGKVLVDGKDIRDNLVGWRNSIGYIPQNIYLTDGSIKNNIALGIPEEEIDMNRIREVLQEAQLTEFVDGLEQGVETEVGERGIRISGGQRQRLGIARALYRNPDILVFDEATSALDTETEKEVMKSIDSLHGTKTMIMIAHRLSTIENCDVVYKVEGGRVERQGGQ